MISAKAHGEGTLTQAGVKTGIKIQLLGSSAQELGELKQVQDEYQRRERIMRERAARPQTKVRLKIVTTLQNYQFLNPIQQLRSTSSMSSSSLQFRFHSIEPLPHLPNPSFARTLLQKLADDPAIKHIMQTHHFSVGVLTELAPHEQPDLLGLNMNAGQVIKLRLRTNDYEGFRMYKEVRRVLCHELVHNAWGDHDDNVRHYSPLILRIYTSPPRAHSSRS